MAEPKIAVVVPLKALNAYVRECLDALRRQTYRNFEVFVITDDPEVLEGAASNVRFLASGPTPPNIKRLQAAKESDADIIACIDDDAYPVPDWLAAAAAHFADPAVVAVGGPGVTPPHDSDEQQASGAVYASPLVSAGYVYRYLPRELQTVDDQPSCNLFVRREPFVTAVPECLRYWPGEDTKLCMLLTRDGSKIVYDPAVQVFHHRRKLFWGHFRQVWNYAVHRGFFAKRYPETSRRPQYFVPTAFVAGNLLALAALLIPRWRGPIAVLAAAYLVPVAAAALASRRDHRVNPLIVALGIYLTHLTYGVGFALGLSRGELDH